MKTIEFTEDACKMIAESLELKLQMKRELLQELQYYKDAEYAKKKSESIRSEIGKLQTLLNYINS